MKIARLCLFIAAILAAVPTLRPDSVHFTGSDLAQLKLICRTLISSQYPYHDLPWQRPWQRLLPYLRNKNDLYRGPLVCSGRCSGSVPLKDGLWLNYTFIDPQKFGEHWGPQDGLIDSITLSKDDKVLLHCSMK
jgi:hypothetical protein